MLGPIIQTAPISLRRSLEAALNLNDLLAANKPRRSSTNPATDSGTDNIVTLVVSAGIAAGFFSFLLCFTLAVSALVIFGPELELNVGRWVDDHRLPTAAVIFVTQAILILAITAHSSRSRKLERLLSETRNNMAEAIAEAKVGLWRWTAASNRVWITTQTQEFLGLAPAADYDAATILSLLHPEDLLAIRGEIATRPGSDEVFEVRVRLAAGDGNFSRWMRCRGHFQTDNTGRLVRVSGVAIDITESMAMQAEIDRQRQSLIHLTRVGAVGELSGALAHELNQPLTSILSNAQAIQRMLSHRPINVAELRDAISDIIEEDSRAGDVIRHFRSLLRKEPAEYKPVDMNSLIQKVLGLVHNALATHRVTPVVKIEEYPAAVLGDDVQLQQLLLNLFLNAVEAIRSAGKDVGTLSITAHGVAGPTGKDYHLSVSDNGHGFEPDAIEKVFEPFFSTKQHGLGLGLSISRAIVNSHGGTIRAERNDVGGATFHVILPTVREESV